MTLRAFAVWLFAVVSLASLPARAAELININTADAAILDTLHGIGPAKAAAIIEYRTKNGPFAVIEDIQKVSGIGPVTFASMKDLITVGDIASSSPPSQPAGQATHPMAIGAQPSPPAQSYKQMQAVEPPVASKAEPIISQKANVQAYEKAVIAPAAATELATAGAALPTSGPVSHASRAAGLFSIWTLGLLGVIALAGGAFIFI